MKKVENDKIDVKEMKALRHDNDDLREKLESVLEKAMKNTDNYIEKEKNNKESVVYNALQGATELGGYYSSQKLSISALPGTIEETERLLNALSGTPINIVEEVREMLTIGPQSYTLEVALFNTLADDIIKVVESRRSILSSLGDYDFGDAMRQLVSTILVLKVNIAKANSCSTKDWFLLSNLLASYKNMLIASANEGVGESEGNAQAEVHIDAKIGDLFSSGYNLDEESLEEIWKEISHKYKMEKYLGEQMPLSKISRLFSLLDSTPLTEVIIKNYSSGNIEGSFKLDVFIISTIAEALLSRLAAYAQIDEDANTLSLIEIARHIDSMKFKNEVSTDILNDIALMVKELVNSKAAAEGETKKRDSSMYG